MLSVDAIISRFRRDLTIATLLRRGILAAAITLFFIGPFLRLGPAPLMTVVAAWVGLSMLSRKGARLVSGPDLPGLIATGQFEQAELRIDSALRSFSLFRTGKLICLHQLAILRHAQRRFEETARLCQALLAQRIAAGSSGLRRTAMLLLADSQLHTGDLRGAWMAITGLGNQRLSLHEAMTLQLLQLDYGSRVADWDGMLQSVESRVQLAELMPAVEAACAQALLALAARRQGRQALAAWLRRRAELLADSTELAADRPLLAQMFSEAW